jgi:hypothetical protein
LAWINDSWCDNDRAPDGFARLFNWEGIKHWEVVSDMQREAQALLEKREFAELSESLASEYVGESVQGPTNTRPYLVRGIYLHKESSAFSVYRSGRHIKVEHSCMGAFPAWRMKRFALIVRLAQPPEKVWVFCSMIM